MGGHTICRTDIMPLDEYAKERAERRRQITSLKKNRRITVGPDITFYFENRDTIFHQIHEMLWIEKGGEAQIEDELRAYVPLIPDGRTLVATMMIEIEEEERRRRVLAGLGGIEETIAIAIGNETIAAVSESEVDRTTPEGKTSSVHFLKFPFSPVQIEAFRTPGNRVVIGIQHDRYDHMAALPEAMRSALSEDFA